MYVAFKKVFFTSYPIPFPPPSKKELVNLLTTGTAVSYVHDGEIDAGGMTLRGVSLRSPIGLLSLFHHYRSLTVGSHLMEPSHPICTIQ